MTWNGILDAQTCFIVMKLRVSIEKLVSLEPGLLQYLGPEKLTQYYVNKSIIGKTILNEAKEHATNLVNPFSFGQVTYITNLKC